VICFGFDSAALISEETIWINDLEEKLSKGSRLSGDAEELSEELDVSCYNLAGVLLPGHVMT